MESHSMPENTYKGVKLFSFTNGVVDCSPFMPYMRRYSQPNTIIDMIPGKADERASKVEAIFVLYKTVLNDMLQVGCIRRAETTTYSTGTFPGPLYNNPTIVTDSLFNTLVENMRSMVDWMIENRQKLL